MYRLCEVAEFPGNKYPESCPEHVSHGPTITADFPEIENFTRFWTRGRLLWMVGDKKLMVDMTAAVDSTFLQLFDFPLIYGDVENALDEPSSIVISERVALNFFGSIDVVGKSMHLNDRAMEVTGVVENVNDNSHLQFDILASIYNLHR